MVLIRFLYLNFDFFEILVDENIVLDVKIIKNIKKSVENSFGKSEEIFIDRRF